MKNEAYAETMELNSSISSPTLMKRPLGRQTHTFYKAALFFNDLVLSMLAYLACTLSIAGNIGFPSNLDHAATIAIFALATIACFRHCKLYNYHIIYDARTHFKQLAMAWGFDILIFISAFMLYNYGYFTSDFIFTIAVVAIAILLLLLRKYIEDYSIYAMTAAGISFIIVGWLGLLGVESAAAIVQSPVALIAGFFLTLGVISLSRYLIVHQLFSNIMKKSFRRQTVIIGSDEQAERITRYIIDNNTPFWIAGVVGTVCEFGKKLCVVKENLGDVINLPQIVEDKRVCEVIVTDESIDKKTLISILDFCASNRINVWFPPNYMPVISIKLYIDQFCGLPMVRLGTQKNHWFFSKLKYSFDALITLPVFLIQLPLFLLIAATVKMTSRGPVFYRATAIGKSGKPFTMYKFRSMRQNSDCAVHKQFVTQLIKGEIKNDCDGTKVLKLTNDDRITPIGKFIRKYSLDELPQLINVLKGDMSLVGPRPCLPYEFEAYEEWHKKRAAVRPGISGLWQVTGRSEVSFEDMILLDLYYIYNRSFSLDVSILFETVFVVIGKKGAC
jgi:exopolysaccharide biosynthesis polyprenyl glycosylphosphotransferase